MESTGKLGVAIYQSAQASAAPNAKLADLDRKLGESDLKDIDVVVCPELFLSGYQAAARFEELAEPVGGSFAKEIAKIARRRGCCIVYGYPEITDGARYNSAVAIGSDGSLMANHHKILLPNAYEKRWFEPGSDLTIFTLCGWKIALLICYDAEFPELARACAREGVALALVPTALRSQWDVVARKVIPARAFENGIFVAYANYGGTDGDTEYLGESCIIGPDGADLARAGGGEELIGAVLDPKAVPAMRQLVDYVSESFELQTKRCWPVIVGKDEVPSGEVPSISVS